MIRKTKLAKIAAVAAGFSMALTSAMPVGAVTIAELQAQIAALMAQLNALQGGTTTTVSVTFTRDLTIGSSGAEVTALQQTLVAQGYLTMPAGVAYGYFGSLTKSAVARWQAAVGLPATGFFGPMSRAKLNAVGGTTTGGSTTGGTTTGGATGGITTPGAEGTIAVTSAPVSTSNYYEGDNMDTVLAFKVKATGSDVAVQRVKIDLGTNSDVYRKAFSKVYLVDDAGKTLASADLNSTNVVKESSNYYVTLSGFSSVVSKDATRTYNIKADVNSSVESTDRGPFTIQLAANAVRAVDGAGIDIYGPASGSEISRSVTISADLAEAASLVLSANPSTPLDREVIASAGSGENEADKVVLLTFDMKAEKDSVKVTDLVATVTRTAGAATASTTYLYVGNGTSGTNLGSASLSGSTATFSDIDYTISKGATQTFTLAADIRNANGTQTTIDSSVTTVTAENSMGDSVSTTGSALGNNVLVRNVGPEFSIAASPVISKSSIVSGQQSTSTATATFTIKVKAVGSDLYLGDTGSTTAPIASTTLFQVYRDGSAVSLAGVASSTVATFSSSFTNPAANSYKLTEGQEGTVTLTFTFKGADAANTAITFGNYSVGLSQLNWVASNGLSNSTFMSGKTEWRTPTVVMP